MEADSDLLITKNTVDQDEYMILEYIPSNFFDEINDKKVFDVKDVYNYVKINSQVLGIGKKSNYSIKIMVLEDGLYLIATDMKIDQKTIRSSHQKRLEHGKAMMNLVSRKSYHAKGQSICLPQQRELDSSRTTPPEIQDGKLLAKDSSEVKLLVDLQNALKNQGHFLGDTYYEKLSDEAPLLIVNEQEKTDFEIELKMQSFDFSKNIPKIRVSVVEGIDDQGNKIFSDPVGVAISEALEDPEELLKLLKFLQYHPEERPSFLALTDCYIKYDVKKDRDKIDQIKLKKLLIS